jgi:hypothetical protein
MTQYGYVAITQRDSSAFVSYCRPGDGLGVVNYDTNGNISFPFSIVDQNLTQAIAASAAIQGLSFNGSNTAIGSGLLTAEGMLNSKVNPRAIVLLSDGFQNYGPAPTSVLPSGYPVYACAMGIYADKVLLQKIATDSGGAFYDAPFPSTMMFIYNQIRGLPSFVQTVTNLQSSIQVQGYQMISAPISGVNSQAQFGVVWDDNTLSYVNSSNPSASQISITLVDPTGQISPLQPQIIGTGYVVFNAPNPQNGSWYIQVISGSPSVTVQVTSGAFEFPVNAEEAPDLAVSVPDSISAGEPLPVTAQVTEKGEAIQGLRVHAEIVRPTVSVANALKTYKDDLKGIKLTDKDLASAVPQDRLRLAKLRKKLLGKKDILAHRSHPLILQEDRKGQHAATLEDTREAGSYNIRVVATGDSPSAGTTFQRTHLVTVLVTDQSDSSKGSAKR